MKEMPELWGQHARQWQRVGSPLRPTRGDIQIMEQLVAAYCSHHQAQRVRALLLGVTPEIATMHWPPVRELLALDRSASMIANVWPGNRSNRYAVCADWYAAPLPPHSRDLIVGDGVLNTLPGAAAYASAAVALGKLLSAHGQIIVRLFVRPARAETPTAVMSALRAGRIGNFHIFKWRLAMALQTDFARGVTPHSVWRAWSDSGVDSARLARDLQWDIAIIETIAAYRNVHAPFSFPTLAELTAVLAATFSVDLQHTPDYEMGERCPTLLLRPRQQG